MIHEKGFLMWFDLVNTGFSSVHNPFYNKLFVTTLHLHYIPTVLIDSDF